MTDLVCRPMTGDAGWHTRRHHRQGHRFPNWHRSIVVGEEPHFLVFIRYGFPNPVQARLIGGVGESDGVPCAGQAAIMGRPKKKP